jgi:hypothetical protein
MSLPVWQASTGTEELLDVVEEVLVRDINEALETVFARREEADIARATMRGVEYIPITYDQVPPNHFHTGNFPSLVLEEIPPDDYPYIVLTIEEYAPTPESNQMDHMNIYREALVVHCLAKADPDEVDPAELVFRRAIRMGEAVFLALASDMSLRSALSAFDNPVRGQHSIPWTAPHNGHGPDYWYQSVGTSYALRNRMSLYQ